MVITDLPAETIDLIAAALDSPTDTRNLAAVCTQLRLLLSPHHSQFRVIRASLISPIWAKIADNRLFSKNVRVVEIQLKDDGVDKAIIPAIFRGLEVPAMPALLASYNNEIPAGSYILYEAGVLSMDHDAERVLVSALKGMSSLTSFRWARTPPLIKPNQEDDIWITLAKYCHSLDTIDVNECKLPAQVWLWGEDDHSDYQRPTFNPNFYLFRDLKSFSWNTEGFNVGDCPFPDVGKCAEMLIRRCPNLEILKLGYELSSNPHTHFVPASPLFSGPQWTSLRELSLSSFDFISTELASFLASHPTIEILILESVRVDQFLVLPPGALPRLQRLNTDCGSTIVNSVLDSTISTPRPLEYIHGSSLNDAFLDSLEHSGSGSSLGTLITVCSGDLNHLIARLSSIAPNLVELNALRQQSPQAVDRSSYPLFGQLPGLQVLQGVRFLDSECKPVSANTECIRALVTACPKMERISWYVGEKLDDRWVVLIKRNESEVTWTVRSGLKGIVHPKLGERGGGSFQL